MSIMLTDRMIGVKLTAPWTTSHKTGTTDVLAPPVDAWEGLGRYREVMYYRIMVFPEGPYVCIYKDNFGLVYHVTFGETLRGT